MFANTPSIGALAEFVSQLGLSVALVLFFVWQASKREQRMAAEIHRLENYQQHELMEANRKMVECIERNTQALQGVSVVIQGCHRNNGKVSHG